ncbi:MAG: chemotaxis protein CheW [Candidatus Sericytochromatia bacterium]
MTQVPAPTVHPRGGTERRAANRGNPEGQDRRTLADRRGENNSLFVSFRLGANHFLLPIDDVQEVQRAIAMTAVPLSPDWIAGIINLRGEIVPAIDLGQLLAGAPIGPNAMNVVVRSDDGVFSLLADEVNDVIEASTTNLVPPPPHLDERLRELVRHVFRVPDALLLVLDVAGIVRYIQSNGGR